MLQGFRVLAVDSDADIATLYAAVLKVNRADYHVASRGEEALARVTREWIPDVVIVHRWLEDMTGAELAAAVRSRAGSHVRVVCTTGDARESTLDSMRAVGCDECLVKPIELDTLVETVAKLGQKARAPEG